MLKSLLISLLFVTLFNLYMIKSGYTSRKDFSRQHFIFGYLMTLYLIISLTEVVGFPSIYQWNRSLIQYGTIFHPEISLVPFSESMDISMILNIILFMPLGFLLPALWKKYNGVIPTLFTGFIFSLVIEISQLFVNYRATDVNDLIMNTLGTLAGWLLYRILKKPFHKIASKIRVCNRPEDSILIKAEPLIYLVTAMAGCFLGQRI